MPTEAPPKPSLPTEKTKPTLSMSTAKLLIYGPPGVGKTTFASTVDPDSTLILATEPGTGGIEAYVQRITSWYDFLRAAVLLDEGDHGYTTIAVDTADELFRMCQEQVMLDLKVSHPSDLEWGKGWQAVADEWRLRVGKLCNLGYGVIFTSHAKDEQVKTRTGAEYTVTQPSLSGQGSKFLLGFVDYVFYATVEHTDDGERRLLRTAPSENWIAKSRIRLPDPLPLDAKAVKAAIKK